MGTTQSLLFHSCSIIQRVLASCSTCCSVSSGRGRPCDRLELLSSLPEYAYFHKGSVLQITHQSGISQAAFRCSTTTVRLVPGCLSRLVVLFQPGFEKICNLPLGPSFPDILERRYMLPGFAFYIAWDVSGPSSDRGAEIAPIH